MSDNKVILPGSTIGILGSGQLGRMLALKARRMGYYVHTFSPDNDSPCGQVADKEYSAEYTDSDAVREFASCVDVVTYEFENVPLSAAEAAAEHAPVRPGGQVLHTVQNRLREKNFLKENGFPCAEFAEVDSIETLNAAVKKLGCPLILKSAGFGYDGKGQARINSPEEAEAAFEKTGASHCVAEAFVPFSHEISVVAARTLDNTFAHYGIMENVHVNHILDVTLSPGRFPESLEEEAVQITHGIMEKLDIIGVACVEFFVVDDTKLLVNEIAPRPHNSGHVTFDNALTCQFEQQLRAVCGMPLGSTERLRPGAMVNLLGDLWNDGEPDWVAACENHHVKLHLYGKHTPRPGRKMGHITALAENVELAKEFALEARKALKHKG